MAEAEPLRLNASTNSRVAQPTLPRLFQEFSPAQDANRSNATGTGRALYVAAQLVAAHGGHIWAESLGTGQGTRFFVELPARLGLLMILVTLVKPCSERLISDNPAESHPRGGCTVRIVTRQDKQA